MCMDALIMATKLLVGLFIFWLVLYHSSRCSTYWEVPALTVGAVAVETRSTLAQVCVLNILE